MAQGYYDDDIYYDASKKKAEQKAQKQAQQKAAQSAYMVTGNAVSGDYQAADTYAVPAVSSLDIDVDTYNRRGQTPSTGNVNANDGDFTYTQRIERFHNPDVVAGSDDEELKEVYTYAMQQPQNINIYVIDADPWNYWGPSWSWRYGNPWYWNSWYYPSYGWGWNSWAWDPYWSWGWGPSWSWGGPAWGPGWSGPAWGPGWGPAQAWRPTTPSGSSRPHNYVGSGATAAHRPGSAYAPSATSRPGNMGRGRYGTSTTINNGASTSRPGSYSPSTSRPSSSSSMDNGRPGNSGRGRSAMNTNNNTNTNNNSNRNSYNTNSNNSYRSSSSSSGSFRSSGGGGSRGGYSGTHGSSGGGGRGRR